MLILVFGLLGMVLMPFALLLVPLALWFMVPLFVLLAVPYAFKLATRRLAYPVPQ